MGSFLEPCFDENQHDASTPGYRMGKRICAKNAHFTTATEVVRELWKMAQKSIREKPPIQRQTSILRTAVPVGGIMALGRTRHT
jgi:hypothetical protein